MNKSLKTIETDHRLLASPSMSAHQEERSAHWDKLTTLVDKKRNHSEYNHTRLNTILRFQVSPAQRVLEIGCGFGDHLASVDPSYGLGIEFSEEMIKRGRKRHPHLNFELSDAHNLGHIREKCDSIIISDFLNDAWGCPTHYHEPAPPPLCTSQTRIIINMYNHLWEVPLKIVKKLGLARPTDA